MTMVRLPTIHRVRAGARPSFGGGGFGGGPISRRRHPGTPVDAVVKWFKGDKGFGFVELSNGTGDAFLHIGALQSAGYETRSAGRQAESLRRQRHEGRASDPRARSRHGWRGRTCAARRASTRRAPARRHPDPATATEIGGTVKWFDDNKGFGFVQSNDGGKDVFVHISILGPPAFIISPKARR